MFPNKSLNTLPDVRESETGFQQPKIIGFDAGGISYGYLPISPKFRNGLIVFGIVYALVVFVGALFGGAPSDARLFLAFSNVVVVIAALLPFFTKEWREGLLSPMIIFSGTMFSAIVAKRTGIMLMGLSDHTVLNSSPSHLTNLVSYDQLLDALSVICLFIGYRAGHNIRTPKLKPAEGKNLLPLALGILGISGLALLIYIGFSGDFLSHVKNLTLNKQSKEFVSDEVEWTGVLVSVACLSHMGLLFLLAYRPKVVFSVAFYCGVVLALIVLALATGKRSSIIYPVLTMLLVWAGVTGRVPYFRIFTGMVIAIFAIGFLGALRTEIQLGDVETAVSENATETSLSEALEGSLEEMSWRVGAYSSRLAILDSVPQEVPLQWGYTYFGAIVRPIPRALLPNKPTGTDSYIGRTFFGADWGIPAGGVGEAYWNFHIPGVCVIFFLFGIFKAWWRNFTFGSVGNPGLIVCYLLTIFVFSSPGDTAYTAWLFTIIPAFACLAFVGGLKFERRKSTIYT